MKAIQIHQYGGPEVLTYEDVPRPQPGPAEVLIRVRAAGVNPVDAKTRAGQGMARRYTNPFPLILGWDVSGVIEAVGSAVTDFEPGDEVYGMVRFPDVGAAYAEFVVAPATDIALKPHSLDHAQAAAMPLVALTAWQALFDAAELTAGQRVLIHAAAGGVGHVAVQLAKWQGATVFGTGSGRNELFLRELGVDEFINYQTTPFETVARDMDVVLDPMAGEIRERSWGTLKKGGILMSILGPPAPETAAVYGVRAGNILVAPNQAQLIKLTGLIDAGHLKPVIDTVLPLSAAAEAHQRIMQAHTRGKIVLQVS